MATRRPNVRQRLNNGPTNTQRGPMITSLRQAIGNGPRAPRARMQNDSRLFLPPTTAQDRLEVRRMRRLAGMSGG